MYINIYIFFLYYKFIIVCLLSFGLSLLLLGICYLLSDNNLYFDKVDGYECGFDPFSDARDPFYIKFYLVSILFLLFDVEIIFFFPWILCQQYVYISGYFFMFFFFIILFLGFVYEWRHKALDWMDI